MKTFIHKLQCWAVVSSVSLLATSYPAFSQQNDNSSSAPSAAQQSQGTSLNDSAATSGVQSVPGMRVDNTEGARIDEPAGADAGTRNWSWVGLFGLLGLFGLKRKHEAHDDTYRPARA